MANELGLRDFVLRPLGGEARRGHEPTAVPRRSPAREPAQLKMMTAIESSRTAALGAHVARCEGCAHTTIAYNS